MPKKKKRETADEKYIWFWTGASSWLTSGSSGKRQPPPRDHGDDNGGPLRTNSNMNGNIDIRIWSSFSTWQNLYGCFGAFLLQNILLNINLCNVYHSSKLFETSVLRFSDDGQKELEKVVDNLDGTKNRKPWEESKSASKNRDLSLEGGFLVLGDLVEQGRVKEDLDQDQSRVSTVLYWNGMIQNIALIHSSSIAKWKLEMCKT